MYNLEQNRQFDCTLCNRQVPDSVFGFKMKTKFVQQLFCSKKEAAIVLLREEPTMLLGFQ